MAFGFVIGSINNIWKYSLSGSTSNVSLKPRTIDDVESFSLSLIEDPI